MYGTPKGYAEMLLKSLLNTGINSSKTYTDIFCGEGAAFCDVYKDPTFNATYYMSQAYDCR